MAAGDTINAIQYAKMDAAAWRHSENWQNKNYTMTICISAPAIYCYYTIGGSGFWGYQEGSFNVYAYNSSTNAFDNHIMGSTESVRGSKSYTWRFKHNYENGTNGDIHDLPLWKIVVYAGNNDGGCHLYLYTGGLSMVPYVEDGSKGLTPSIYESYFKDKMIYQSKGDYFVIGNTYKSETEFLAAEGPSAMRGTPIAVSTETYKYISTRGW